LTPDNPEAWYDLASTQAVLDHSDEALRNLAQAIRLSDVRRQIDGNARDLRLDAATNTGFVSLREHAKFQALMERP
jgi:hypothetical protein